MNTIQHKRRHAVLVGVRASAACDRRLCADATIGRTDTVVGAGWLALPGEALINADIDEALAQRASHWLHGLRGSGDTMIVNPVSRLQCAFLLGYRQACVLAAVLVKRGQWTIGLTASGVRYACLHGKAPA